MDEGITIAIITGLFGLAGTIVSGILAARAMIKKEMLKAQKQADEKNKHNRERATASRYLIACICKEIFWISHALKKKDLIDNGELEQLEKAMTATEEAEAELREVERQIVANE